MKIQELIDQLTALDKPNANIVLLGNTGDPEDEDTDMYFDKLEVWNDGEDSITIFVGLNEENSKSVIKKNLIVDIQKIIGEFGSFNTADIEADCDVSIPTIGNHIHLAGWFNYSDATVEVYENGGENEIDSYRLSYYDMDIDTLEEVLKYAQDYEAMCLQDEDRQGVNQ
jgi:hypothetical protein